MAQVWTVELASEDFARFMRRLPAYEQDVVDAAISHVLAVEGIAICETEWGTALGGGLNEFRVRRSVAAILNTVGISGTGRAKHDVLVRVFCAFSGNRVVIRLGGYDKRRDASVKRQQREIAAARRVLADWKRDRRG